MPDETAKTQSAEAARPDQRDTGRMNEPMLRWFRYQHLPPHLAAHSRPFCELAHTLCATLPRNPERTVALRKLLESKDAAVRAALPEDAS